MTRPVTITLTVAVLISLGLIALGQGGAWVSPDTASYLQAARSAQPLGEMRLPVFGWLIAPAMDRPWLLAVLVWLQAGAFVAAALWLVRALGALELSASACTAVGVSLVASDVMLLWSRALLPEMLGHAALITAFAAVVEIAAGRPSRARGGVCILATALGWALRPSLLPFIVLLPCLLMLLPGQRSRRSRLAMALLIGGLVPFAGLSAWRLAAVGDFNVVSFGGFQMSGMAALMLTPAIADRLPPDERATARTIVQRRAVLEAAGRAAPIPVNSHGQRSFVSAAVFYFDILARTHDTVLYEAVAPLRGDGESWPGFNRRMQRLALSTIAAAPADYVAWVIGATTRLVGHALVINAAFMLAAIALAASLLTRRCRPGAPADLQALLAISAVYFAGTAGLVVLTTFPASRYIDSAGMLLPVWPLYGLFRAWSGRAGTA